MDEMFIEIDLKIANQSLPYYQALALLKDELLILAEESGVSDRQIYRQYLEYRENAECPTELVKRKIKAVKPKQQVVK